MLGGTARVEGAGHALALSGVSWVLIPAALGVYHLHTETDCVCLRVFTP